MKLKKIDRQDAEAQWAYTTALPENENGLSNPHHGVSYDRYVAEVLPELISHEHPVHMPDWFVPESYYYLWDGDEVIGEFRIRHRLTEALRKGAGHIGYSIRRDRRGQGCGTAGLKLCLQIAASLIGEEEVFLRVQKGNPASRRVMEKNGAYLAGEDEGHDFLRIAKSEILRPVVTTDRLLVDILRESDREDYFRNISHDKKVLETFVCRYQERLEDFDFSAYLHRDDLFAIRKKDSRELIGIFVECEKDREHRCMEIGYGLGSSHWGRGYMTEVVWAMLDHYRQEGYWQSITASFFPENIASKRVMEKCGMHYSHIHEKEFSYLGRERDLIYYRLPLAHRPDGESFRNDK